MRKRDSMRRRERSRNMIRVFPCPGTGTEELSIVQILSSKTKYKYYVFKLRPFENERESGELLH
jgi:hypothetical protein